MPTDIATLCRRQVAETYHTIARLAAEHPDARGVVPLQHAMEIVDALADQVIRRIERETREAETGVPENLAQLFAPDPEHLLASEAQVDLVDRAIAVIRDWNGRHPSEERVLAPTRSGLTLTLPASTKPRFIEVLADLVAETPPKLKGPATRTMTAILARIEGDADK
jgi:hypothetical protein